MANRNASASAFGWDFQVNAAIVLMLENIKETESIRIEGKDDDIEIELNDKSKIYAQAKSFVNPFDTNNVIKQLTGALETLNDDAKNDDVSLLTYITNSSNPFNNVRTLQAFLGLTHLYYDELPKPCKDKINEIIKKKKYTSIDTSKLDIRVLPFYGKDDKNKYKIVKAYISDIISDFNITDNGISQSIMEIWQQDYFHNATKPNTDIKLSKENLIWPLIVLVVDNVVNTDYIKELSDDQYSEVNEKYKLIINNKTLRFDLIAKVMTDYQKSEYNNYRDFTNSVWKDYLPEINSIDADDLIKETLIKIIIYKILQKHRCITTIKKEVNL